jgi:hypothetical protein
MYADNIAYICIRSQNCIVMDKDLIFFSNDGNGLTSTSANHVANLAKEMIRGLEDSLGALTLYSTSVSLIGSETSDLLINGADSDELGMISNNLSAVAKAKSLIAWLREAIKAKERMIKKVESTTNEDYMKLMEIEAMRYPERGHVLTDDEYYASLSVDERNRYYELETLSAVLGKAIHPEGAFAEARDKLNAIMRRPHEVKGDGRDTLIYTFTPTVDAEDVEKLYFKLQKRYREAQASLNAIKYECEKAVKESQMAVATEYAANLAKYNDFNERIRAERTAYIKDRVREIGNLKILIPQSLKDIYETVTHLGKK